MSRNMHPYVYLIMLAREEAMLTGSHVWFIELTHICFRGNMFVYEGQNKERRRN